jgi:hypothetical protein
MMLIMSKKTGGIVFFEKKNILIIFLFLWPWLPGLVLFSYDGVMYIIVNKLNKSSKTTLLWTHQSSKYSHNIHQLYEMIFICYITEHLSSPLDFIIRENLHMLHYGAPEFTPGITEHLSSPLALRSIWVHPWHYRASEFTPGITEHLSSPLALRSIWVHPWMLVRFVLLDV